MLGRTTIGDLSYAEGEWAEKVRVSVGEGGKWTVFRHCRVAMCREEKGSPLVDRSGWDWAECLRMGRGNATLIGDIGEGGVGDASRGSRTWEQGSR
jgi:hypothetical protein